MRKIRYSEVLIDLFGDRLQFIETTIDSANSKIFVEITIDGFIIRETVEEETDSNNVFKQIVRQMGESYISKKL